MRELWFSEDPCRRHVDFSRLLWEYPMEAHQCFSFSRYLTVEGRLRGCLHAKEGKILIGKLVLNIKKLVIFYPQCSYIGNYLISHSWQLFITSQCCFYLHDLMDIPNSIAEQKLHLQILREVIHFLLHKNHFLLLFWCVDHTSFPMKHWSKATSCMVKTWILYHGYTIMTRNEYHLCPRFVNISSIFFTWCLMSLFMMTPGFTRTQVSQMNLVTRTCEQDKILIIQRVEW